MPDGWSLDKSKDSGDNPIKCLNKLGNTAKQGSSSHGEVKFVKGTDFPSVDEAVANYDQGGASAAISNVSSRLDSCAPFKYTDSGTEVSGQISPMKFSVVGLTDQHAYQVTIGASGLSVAGVYLIGRKGDTLMLFAYGDAGSPDLEAIRPLANAAVAKLG